MKFQKIWYSLLAVLLAVFLFWLFSQILIVKKVDCTLDQHVCPDFLLQQTQKLTNRSLIFTDFDLLISRFTFNQPIKFTRVQKNLPVTLKAEFETIPIVYQLKFTSQTFDVANDGKLYEKNSSETVEILISDQLYDRVIEKGSIKPSINLQITQVLKLLAQEHQKIVKFSYQSPENVVLILENNPQILLNSDSMLISLSEYLRLIKPEIPKYTTVIMEVDLRFKYPILRSSVSQI